MLAKWERIYRGFFYGLLVAVAALVLWKFIPVWWEAMVTGGWRARSAFVFLVTWYLALRLAARTKSFRAFVVHWKSRGVLSGLCFNLLVLGFPLGLFAYLAPRNHRVEPIVWIVVMSVLTSIVEWSEARKADSHI
jgi:hypothetical protein